MTIVRMLERLCSKLTSSPFSAGAVSPESDRLTGLLTYAGLIAAADAGASPGAVVLFDLDHFRKINTALDLVGGDRVLIEVARRLRALSPAGALIARTGIDEFAILLPAGSIDRRQFAARVSREIARPIDAGAEQLEVSISIGLAEPVAGETVEGMLLRAGSAMRNDRAPEPPGNADLAAASSPAGIRQRFTLERELREGFASGELRLFYQPIVNLQTHVADELEALLRWDHPDRGTLLPKDFLFEIASDALLRDIGRWVLRAACEQGRLWQEQRPDRPLVMAVNLSSSQIRDPHLLDDVHRILEETGFDPAALRLEISEGITLDELESAVHLVREIRRIGVRLALDDFGTGNAGWTLLRQAQIDTIKLDQSFISVANREAPDNMRLIEALARFASHLGMAVSIEGVERADQVATMREIGIHHAQGFYFSPPRPPGQVASLLDDEPLRPTF